MKDLTKDNIYKTFLFFAIPLVLAGALSQAYQTADTVIAGKYLGEEGLAAIGSTSSYVTLISSLFWGSNIGIGVYIAKLFGGRKYNSIIKNFKFHFLLELIACAVLSIFSIALYQPIFSILNVDESIYRLSFEYYAVYVGGLFFISLLNMLVNFLRGLGVARISLIVTVISAILNVGGNIFTIVVLDMGVIGLALSSVLSAFTACLVCLIYLLKCFKEIKRFGQIPDDVTNYKESLKYTLPTSFQQFCMYVFTVVISALINGISVSAVAAFTIVQRVYNINTDVYQNSTTVIGTYSAQCIGMGKENQIKKGLKVGILQSILIALPILSTCVFAPKFVSGLFLDKTESAETLDYAVSFAKFFLPFIIFNIYNNASHNLYRGTGKMSLLITVTFSASIIRLIFSFLLVSEYALNGIYSAWVISWVAEAIINFIVYLSGKWSPKKR